MGILTGEHHMNGRPTSLPPANPDPGWSADLYAGAPGIALLHIERARTGAAGWGTVQKWARAMTAHPVTAHADASGLDRGAPAVAFALHAAGHHAYSGALTTLDHHIANTTRTRLRRAHARIEAGQLPDAREFDLIRGLAGIGVFLLHRERNTDHGQRYLLREVIAYLVRLTQPVTVDGDTLPGWWSHQAPPDRPHGDPRGGHADLGLAHGITGPLALLSLASRRKITVTGHADAIDRICRWLDQWAQGTAAATWWPESVSRYEHHEQTLARRAPGRPSWCYGTPGIARAQQLAGLARDDSDRARRAEQALAECLADHHQLALIRDASLCHGWAGLLHTTARVAANATDDRLASTALPQLRYRLSEHLRRSGLPGHDGLLTGAAGVRLAQYGDQQASHSWWDACLLLDDDSAL
ncbi:lanthionine synthetase C family protein [Fodinicola feengrottensis]|uniref:Lanthionine synthetase C family protein n=1 Tax=Fodinicola feengrottensis TaxID=435914 RepID=A0ABN2GM82_9ACTN